MIRNIKESKGYINESSLSRLVNKMLEHDCGLISAFRSEYNSGENIQRNKSLEAKLVSKGYRLTLVDGTFIENFGTDNEIDVNEDTYFVEDWKNKGMLKEDLIKLGEHFKQDSIMYIPKVNKVNIVDNNKSKHILDAYSLLIGTKENAYPGYRNEVKLPIIKIGDRGNEFLTKVKNRPFYFKECHKEDIYAGNNLGRYSALIYAKKDWKDL